jgi:hypothetical protein
MKSRRRENGDGENCELFEYDSALYAKSRKLLELAYLFQLRSWEVNDVWVLNASKSVECRKEIFELKKVMDSKVKEDKNDNKK